MMVDAFSLLIHLGPTVIGGGDFYHRAAVTNGPCIPVHAAVKVAYTIYSGRPICTFIVVK